MYDCWKLNKNYLWCHVCKGLNAFWEQGILYWKHDSVQVQMP